MGFSYRPSAVVRQDAAIMRRWMLAAALCAAASSGSMLARADYTAPLPAYAPPTNYYANATGTGSALRMSLHTIISTGFVQRSYDDARVALADTDKDPNNPNDILTIYDRSSLSNVWNPNASTGWNREHMWPASRINGATSGPTADLFELRPAAEATNGGRGNLPYGGGPTASGGPYVDPTKTFFFPGDADKGDVSRAMFYMATMYYTGSATLSPTNLQLINGYFVASKLPDYEMGDLASMLAWNYQDGVDSFERNRNQMIYSNTIDPTYSQKNRNPYVDHPEYVWAVWGDRPNNAQISVGTPASDGTSTTTVDVGRILVGSSFATGTATFTKTGYTPTTFDITTSGNATIPNATSTGTAPAGYLIAGAGQGIDFNNQTRLISVGLNASTATTGLKSGSITIHDTDLTSAGAGFGSADGDDLISVTGSVLAKRTITTSTNAINFGTVIVGATVSQNVGLSTTGDDSHATRVNVAGNSPTDANGISITGTTSLFNSAGSTASRSVGGTLTTVGGLSGVLSLGVTTAENGGAGLSGEGTYPNINVSYAANVLSHATPSFSATVSTPTLTLSFPTVTQNATSTPQTFSLANLASATAAGLAFTGDTVTGPAVFSTNLSPFPNEAQNTTIPFSASLNTTALGTYSTTYTLQFADEQDLPGATPLASLTLILTGSVALLGDTNLDGAVDLNDLTTVLNNLGALNSSWAAGNFDGAPTIDLTDLNDVLNNLGISANQTAAPSSGETVAAPEPASLAVLIAAIPSLLARRRRGKPRAE
jgi:endonuclease I